MGIRNHYAGTGVKVWIRPDEDIDAWFLVSHVKTESEAYSDFTQPHMAELLEQHGSVPNIPSKEIGRVSLLAFCELYVHDWRGEDLSSEGEFSKQKLFDLLQDCDVSLRRHLVNVAGDRKTFNDSEWEGSKLLEAQLEDQTLGKSSPASSGGSSSPEPLETPVAATTSPSPTSPSIPPGSPSSAA